MANKRKLVSISLYSTIGRVCDMARSIGTDASEKGTNHLQLTSECGKLLEERFPEWNSDPILREMFFHVLNASFNLTNKELADAP
jgi:hypothetical protein